MDIEQSLKITSIIENNVIKNADKTGLYREPLIGYVSVNNVKTKQTLKRIKQHIHPFELLPNAKTICSFFLPFKKEIVLHNRTEKPCSRKWAEAYIITNQTIERICENIKSDFQNMKIDMSFEVPSRVYDKKALVAQWSHRHAAWACGLGEFGVNNMLITSKGCAGRYGSFVFNRDLDSSLLANNDNKQYCKYKIDKSCNYCINNCPVGALTVKGFDRHKCLELLNKIEKYFNFNEKCKVCGKCSCGPCAFF